MMDKNLIKSILIDQQAIKVPSPYTKRHIEKDLLRLIKNPSILIITGLRRCGKSVMLQWLRQHLDESSYYVNFDDDRFATFTLADFQSLYECLIELYGEESTFYFDEIQNIDEWERFVRRLHNEQKKVIITGSNASMLSRELGTRLTGRHITLEMFPYNFHEYVLSQGETIGTKAIYTTAEKAKLKAHFNRFMHVGGIPEYVKHQDDEYIRSIYDNILYRDIIVRHGIKHEKTIKELVYYLASNNAKDTSFNALKNLLKIKGTNTVGDYCAYLEDAYLCSFINRYDPSLKAQMGYAKKVYFIDATLSRLVGFKISDDKGRLLENLVYNELRQHHQHIYMHKQDVECDFVVQENHHITQAIQVTASLSNPTTKTREIKGLLSALNAYGLNQGLILTEDETGEEKLLHNDKTYHIQILPIWQWMLTA